MDALGLAPTLHHGLCNLHPGKTFYHPQRRSVALSQGTGGLPGQRLLQTLGSAPDQSFGPTSTRDEEPREKLRPNSRRAVLNRKDGVTTRPLGSWNFLPKTLSGK